MKCGESIPNCHLIINDNKILILPFKKKRIHTEQIMLYLQSKEKSKEKQKTKQ